MNSNAEELNFLLSILCDLKRYEDHNPRTLDAVIDIIRYRIELSNRSQND